MDPLDDKTVCTDKVLPYFGAVPQSAELQYYAVQGFEIPTLPALPPEHSQLRGELVKSVLYRFRSYITELHSTAEKRSISLQFMSHPMQANFRARVRCYVLCRTAHADEKGAREDVEMFAQQAMRTFPQEGIFSYGGPQWLSRDDLKVALFQQDGSDASKINIAEIRKFEESETMWRQPSLHYIPHRLWADQQRDPWLSLIETLASTTVENTTAVRIELTPVRIAKGQGLEFISLAGRWFDVLNEDLARKASQGEKVSKDGIVTEEMTRQDELALASSNAAATAYIKRGRHIYEKLITYSDSVFCMRVILAANGKLSEAVVGSVRAALSTPPADDPNGAIGWIRPEVVKPNPGEAADALNSLRFMVQNRWGRSPPNEGNKYKLDLRPVVTPEEAVSLFHVPIYDRMGQTSALSTAETPFVIPPETLDKKRFRPKDQKIMIGYMFQREKLLAAVPGQDNGHPFYVTANDLMKPSLLVGAPGSGKTNLAFSLLIQLWKSDPKIPFLVLDPSTGQEFRMLMRDSALEKDLVVYTVGDQEGMPLQFNPFSVPPGVTVRNHTTRILAAFRAAFTMFDPVPAIYEGALERIYTDPRYTGGAPVMTMEQKGDLNSPAPTLANFAQAIQDELNEKALTLYQGSAESIGVIRGASTIRVNAIGKKIGHIINVAGNNGMFLQRMLQKPVVIEMGSLGDSSNIALVMAFFLSQLAGHIEYAYHQDQTQKRQHVILIEEAHRLLAGGEAEGIAGKSAEDLNMMLAEVRKFGQGIMVMDQRPSSLVGGVLDNAYIKILTRLSDRAGFARLSDELNLNEAQQRYARTRLKTGDAIVLDRDAGQPVLMRSENVKERLENATKELKNPKEDTLQQMRDNAKNADLIPPPFIPYVEPSMQAAAGNPDAAAKSRDWLNVQATGAMKGLLDELRKDSDVYHAAKTPLEGGAQDVEGAKSALDLAIEKNRGSFDRLTDELWEKVKWAVVGLVAEETASKDAQARVRDLRAAAKAPAASTRQKARTNGATPPAAKLSDGLQQQVDRLGAVLADLVGDARKNANLWWGVKQNMLPDKPSPSTALDIVRREMKAHRAQFDEMAGDVWQGAMKAIFDKIAAETMDDATVATARARALASQSKSDRA